MADLTLFSGTIDLTEAERNLHRWRSELAAAGSASQVAGIDRNLTRLKSLADQSSAAIAGTGLAVSKMARATEPIKQVAFAFGLLPPELAAMTAVVGGVTRNIASLGAVLAPIVGTLTVIGALGVAIWQRQRIADWLEGVKSANEELAKLQDRLKKSREEQNKILFASRAAVKESFGAATPFSELGRVEQARSLTTMAQDAARIRAGALAALELTGAESPARREAESALSTARADLARLQEFRRAISGNRAGITFDPQQNEQLRSTILLTERMIDALRVRWREAANAEIEAIDSEGLRVREALMAESAERERLAREDFERRRRFGELTESELSADVAERLRESEGRLRTGQRIRSLFPGLTAEQLSALGLSSAATGAAVGTTSLTPTSAFPSLPGRAAVADDNGRALVTLGREIQRTTKIIETLLARMGLNLENAGLAA